MKIQLLLTVFALILSVSGFAADKSTYSEAVYVRNNASIFGAMGFGGGGLILGADYEYHMEHTFGVGGYARMAQKDDGNQAYGSGATLFGGFIRPHFHRRQWDFHLTVGFGIINIDPAPKTQGSESGFGPNFGLGLLYQLNPRMALGVENNRYYNWFGDDYKGAVIDIMTVNFRYSL